MNDRAGYSLNYKGFLCNKRLLLKYLFIDINKDTSKILLNKYCN